MNIKKVKTEWNTRRISIPNPERGLRGLRSTFRPQVAWSDCVIYFEQKESLETNRIATWKERSFADFLECWFI